MSSFTSIAMTAPLTPSSAPTSSQVVSGTVAKPSLLAEGCTSPKAACVREKEYNDTYKTLLRNGCVYLQAGLSHTCKVTAHIVWKIPKQYPEVCFQTVYTTESIGVNTLHFM